MDKLTKETLESYRNTYDRYEGIESNEFERICDELIEYKSLEEELGIDLITLFKALKQGIWYKFKTGNIQYISDTYLSLEFYFDHYAFWINEFSRFNGKYINLKDYGTKWSLRKEDLENEKED